MSPREREELLTVRRAGPIEPPEPKDDPDAARGGEPTRVRLGGQIPARHRKDVVGGILVDPLLAAAGVEHADRLLHDAPDARLDRGTHDGRRPLGPHTVIRAPRFCVHEVRGRRDCRR